MRCSKIELVDVVGVKHRWRPQQDYSVFVNRAIAELAGLVAVIKTDFVSNRCHSFIKPPQHPRSTG